MKISPTKFLILLLCSIPFVGAAQLSFGVKGGVNFQYLKIEQTFKTEEDYSGVELGIYADMKLTEKLCFITELQFSTRKYDVDIFSYDIYMGYADIPLLLSWHPVKPISLEAGPYIAFKLYGKSDSNHEYPDEAFSESLDAGLVAGLRIHITKKISIIPRYWMGITPVADTDLFDDVRQPLGNITAYNRVIETSLAWKIK